ncbi:MAG TPA: PIN domain-containing protein [Pyrinomonadaceae bacterium]|nr:PIN domain-containing protein [Pyrinomonadaceae bacterium]HMP65995.1 PIN domain-containing protein [Pyrinomonadaceae bacterium]
MNIFIDTNIYLDFFDFSNEDLEELRKIDVLIKSRKIQLLVTDQVISEFRRNRDSKIANTIIEFRKKDFPPFPQLIKGYDEYSDLISGKKDYEKAKNQLLSRIEEDMRARNLVADQVIEQIFSSAELIATTSLAFSNARVRRDVGNPPGKRTDPLGDEINWELLLARVRDSPFVNEYLDSNYNLHLISYDQDWESGFRDQTAHQFLRDEWTSKVGGEMFLYKRISSFLQEHFPQILLASELEKQLLINDLAGSGTFAQTHGTIRTLSKIDSFDVNDANDLIDAYINNSQVNWIIADDDVCDFLIGLLENHVNEIDEEKREALLTFIETETSDRHWKDRRAQLLTLLKTDGAL